MHYFPCASFIEFANQFFLFLFSGPYPYDLISIKNKLNKPYKLNYPINTVRAVYIFFKV